MRLSIPAKLLGAFALDLALMLALGVFALDRMREMHTRAQFVEAQTLPSLANVERVSHAVSRYRLLQLEHLVLTSEADKARLEAAMGRLEEEMAGFLEVQRTLASAVDEEAALERVRRAWYRFVTSTHRDFLPSSRIVNTGAVHPVLSRLNPLYQDVLDTAQGLAEATGRRATLALRDVQHAYDGSKGVFLAETVAALLLSAAVGLFLALRISRRVARLTAASRAVAGGDLERAVEVQGGDELADLARDFNGMVRSLHEERSKLEERNAQLAASLESQRQLMSDLVERERAEQAALQARAAAEAASQAKSIFLATMSHELRTPLTAILGYAQLLHMAAEARGDGENLLELERIRAAGKHLLTIISNILDFSKIEQGKMDVEISRFDVAALAREVADIVEPLARQRGDSLEVVVATEATQMESDAAKLRQVLFNLLSNAIKFTEAGHIRLAIDTLTSDAEPWVRCVVSDTGIGIAAAQMPHLFEPFHQAHPTDAMRYGGTGIGLALSQQLCQLLGGRIEVESLPGRGTRFTVLLPRRAVLAAGADAAERTALSIDQGVPSGFGAFATIVSRGST